MPRRDFNFGGTAYLLDARPDRLDLRDRGYLPPMRSLPPRYPEPATLKAYLASYIKNGLILDQGNEGACTGFGLAAVVNYLLWTLALETNDTRRFRPVSPHMLFDLAQFYDEWPGEEYDGSSCRGAMKGWHKHGVCEASLWSQSVRRKAGRPYKPRNEWAFDAATRPVGVYYRVDRNSVVDMQAAILNMGAIYVSAGVHAGWQLPLIKTRRNPLTHGNLPVIPFAETSKAAGAHAFALVGYNQTGFIVQNSWGTAWGANGFAVMTYADWVSRGADAWVCSLGVPQSTQPTGAAVITRAPTRQLGASLLSGDPPLGKSALDSAVSPWPTQRAYQHTLVAGNNGQVRMSMPNIGSAEVLVDLLVNVNAGRWLAGMAETARKVMIYAHGGLNDEEASLKRVRVLAPYFLANGIYPLFYTWRTGALETIKSRLEDALGIGPAEAAAGGLFGEAKDYLLEAAAHAARGIWDEMKSNAEAAQKDGRALQLLVRHAGKLANRHPGTEFHLMGHSAGSLVNGFLADMMSQAGIAPASLTLLAPACSLEFGLTHFKTAVDRRILPADRLWLHLLSDQREQEDAAGPYGKSLLYLVCRGFEEVRKTPIAGLQRCIDATATDQDDTLWNSAFWPQVLQWRAWVGGLPLQADGRPACEIVVTDRVSTGKQSIAASHGSFDQNREVIERSINRILGKAPNAALTAPVEDLNGQ